MSNKTQHNPRMRNRALLVTAILAVATVIAALMPNLYGCARIGTSAVDGHVTGAPLVAKVVADQMTVGSGDSSGDSVQEAPPGADAQGGEDTELESTPQDGDLLPSDPSQQPSDSTLPTPLDQVQNDSTQQEVEIEEEVETTQQPSSFVPTSKVLKKKITVGEKPAEGEPDRRRTYSVQVTYDSSANIPEGTELMVSEVEATDESKAALREQLRLQDKEHVIAETYLSIALHWGGFIIQPTSPVEVVVETKEIAPATSDAVEAVVLSEPRVVVPVENLTGKRENGEEDERPTTTKLQLTTMRFGVFGLVTTITPFDSWTYDGQTVALLGPRTKSVMASSVVYQDEKIDDMSLLRSVTFQTDPVHAWRPILWAESRFEDEYDAANGAVICRRWVDDHTTDEVFGKAGTDKPVAIASDGVYVFLLDAEEQDGEEVQDESQPRDDQSQQDLTQTEDTQDEIVEDENVTQDAKGEQGSEQTSADQKSADQKAADDAKNADSNTQQDKPSQTAKDEDVIVVTEDGKRPESTTPVVYENTYTASDGRTYRVKAQLEGSAGIPNSAKLVVREVAKSNAEYASYLTQSSKALDVKLNEVSFAKVLDISFVDPISGKEYQPSKDVLVTIDLLGGEISNTQGLGVVHFGDKVESVDAVVQGDAVTFATDGFSVFVVMGYTVDFQQGEYIYSIAGESSVTLSKLFQELKITEVALNEVSDVVFSDPTLIQVEKKDGDWLLSSLKPFATEETLSIMLNSGSTMVIRVTDEQAVNVTLMNGDQVFQTVEKVVGQPIGELPSLPSELIPEGCSLKWCLENSTEAITADYVVPEGGVTLYAQFDVTVTFMLDGEDTPFTTKTFDKGTAIGELPVVQVPDKHRFDGWHVEGKEDPITAETTFDASATATGSLIEQVTVTFKKDDGSVAETKVIDKGTAIGSADFPQGPALEGCTFKGWFAGDTEVSANTQFKEDTEVTAKYTVDVTFVVKNADYTAETSSNKVTLDKDAVIGDELMGEPSAPDSTYKFKGWFVEGTDGKPSDQQATKESSFSASTRLVARFDKQVTITFVDTSGEGSDTRQSFTVDLGQSVDLIDNPNKSGHRFDGWFEGDTRITNSKGITNPQGELIDAEGNVLPEGATPVRSIVATRNMELLPRFVEIITVRFLVVDFVNRSTSTGLPSINVHKHADLDKTGDGLPVEDFPVDPAMSGYEFQGWYGIKRYQTYEKYSDVPAEDRDANGVFVLDKNVDGVPYVLDETAKVEADKTYTESTDVVAKFAKKLRITFQYDGKQSIQEYLVGETLSAHTPDDAEKDGYRLEWYREDDEDDTPSGDYVVKESDDNAVFNARYIEQATITFKVGDQEAGKLSVDKGTSVQASGKTWPADPDNPTGSGAHFIGWYDADNHKVDAQTNLLSNVEVTAQFGYTVDFYAEDKPEIRLATREVQENTALGWLPTAPYREGYTFKEWRIGDQVIDADYVVNSNVTVTGYYAELSIYTVTINYTINGNSEDTKVLTLNKGALSAENPETVTSPSSFGKSDGIYYPVMQAVQIVPEGNTLGVKDKHNEVTVVEDPVANITINVPYRLSDSTYTVRYVLKDLSGTGYSTLLDSESKEGIKGASVMPEVKEYDHAEFERLESGILLHNDGDIFNVYYTRKNFTLSYDTKGGRAVDSVTSLYGTIIGTTANPLPTPTRDGYTFDGWYDNPNYTGSRVTRVTLERDTVLYAKWTANTVNYTIVYMLEKYNNATGTTTFEYDNSITRTGQVGTEVVATSAPNISGTRNGYERDDNRNASSKITITADGSAVLKVYYKLIRYTLVFNINRNTGRITMNGQTYTGSNYRVEDVVLGQDVSPYWPATSSEIYDTGGQYFRYWSGAGGNYVTKRYELIWDNVVNANSNHVMTYTASWTSDNYNRNAEYWLQQPDGTYKVEDSYTQIGLNTNNLGAKDIDGYTKHNGTPYGYQGSGNTTTTVETYIEAHEEERDETTNHGPTWQYNGYVWTLDYTYTSWGWRHYVYKTTIPGHYEQTQVTTYVYRFYYDRMAYKIDYYYGTTNLTTKENILFGSDISGSTYNFQPSRPTGVENDYVWDGWFTDSACTTPFDFTTMPGHNVALYTKWHAPSFAVTFHLNYEGASPEPYIDPISVEKYKTVSESISSEVQNKLDEPTPAPAHHIFTDWYTQAEDGEVFDPAGKTITQDTDVYANWKPKGISYTVHYYKAGTTETILPSKTVTGNLTVGQEVTELAPYVTGYHLSDEDPSVTMVADVGSQTITLDYENNLIVFYYGKKPKEIKYTVNYVLESDHSTSVADSVTKTVPGSYTSVTETAATPKEEFKDYYPIEVTKTYPLGTDEAQNVITFYYTRGARVNVSYLDMEGDAIPGKSRITTFQEVGETFTVDTNLPGYTLKRIVKNNETTTDTSFTPTSNTESFDIKVYYQYDLKVSAQSRTRTYNGEALTDEGTYETVEEVAQSGVKVTGLKSTHRLTGITIEGSQTNAGYSLSTPSNAVIAGLKEGVSVSDFYNISDSTYVSGYLTVTPINVIVSLEPDRWTGNYYDGTVKMTGFTNPDKSVDNYLLISDDDFKDDHEDQIWAEIVQYLKTEKGAIEYGTLNDGNPGLAVIRDNKDVGDYYEPAGTFGTALVNALGKLNLENYNVVHYARESHLEILPLPVKIATSAAEKPYDGKPLTSSDLTVTITTADGTQTVDPIAGTTDQYKLTNTDNVVTIKTSGSQTKPGASRNTYTINWGSDKAENYSITEELGTLNVTRRKIIIKVQDDVKPYKMPDPAIAVKAFYEADDGQGGTTEVEIPATLTHWSGDAYTLKLNDAEHGFTDNLSLTIARENKSEVPGVYEVKAQSSEGAEDNYEIDYRSGNLTIAIARVSNDNGATWSYHEYLVHDKGERKSIEGAFNKASGLTGDVRIETLCETAHIDGEAQDRYALPTGQSVAAGQNLSIRTTQEPLWNPTGTGHFDSIVTRVTDGYGGKSMLTLNSADSSLTIRDLILDGGSEQGFVLEGAGKNLSGGVVNAMKGTKLYIQNVTIRNSHIKRTTTSGDANGGGIYGDADVKQIDINDVVFSNCSVIGSGDKGISGGGAYFEGKATVNCVTVQDCHADGDKGGGIYFYTSGSKLGTQYYYTDDNGVEQEVNKPSSFQNCSAKRGGGMNVYQRGCTIAGTESNRVSFANCVAQGDNGGGIAFYDDGGSGSDKISYATFTGCTTNKSGGAICTRQQSSEISNVTITDCKATESGGGIMLGTTGTLTNVTINGHYLLQSQTEDNAKDGGAIRIGGGTLTLKGEVLIQNCTATNGGGGISANTANIKMTEGTPSITGCTAPVGGAIYLNGGTSETQISTGTITSNTATGWGGGAIRMEGGATAKVSGGVFISGNRVTGNNAERNGGAISIKKGTMTIAGGTISNNSVETSGKPSYGGAIHVSGTGTGDKADDGHLSITGGTISGNAVTSNSNVYGGAISVRGANATASISGGSIRNNGLQQTTAANKDALGGAVSVLEGAQLTLTGGAFNNNTATAKTDGYAKGAAIYVDATGSTVRLSGQPTFGSGGNANTVTLSGYSSNKNGGEDVYTGDQVRQDIFIAGYKDVDAPSLVVTGPLSGAAGSIWIWAGEDSHYLMLEQFAVFEGTEEQNVRNGMTEAQLAKTFAAFRNAQADTLTGCGGSYLTGQSGEKYLNIYWTGGFDFTFVKTDPEAKALNDATFTLYRANANGDDILKDTTTGADVAYQRAVNGVATNVTGTSRTVSQDAPAIVKVLEGESVVSKAIAGDGLVTFEKVPPGTYFVKETVFPKVDPTNTAQDAARYFDQYKDTNKANIKNEYRYMVMRKVTVNANGTTKMEYAVTNEKGEVVLNAQNRPTWKDAPTTKLSVVGGAQDETVPVYTFMNVSPFMRKVILRKVAEDNNKYTALEGAKFRIYGADWRELVDKEYESDSTTGVYFVDTLPYGVYRLVETEFPDGYAPAGYGTFNADDPSTYWYYDLYVGDVNQQIDAEDSNGNKLRLDARGTYVGALRNRGDETAGSSGETPPQQTTSEWPLMSEMPEDGSIVYIPVAAGEVYEQGGTKYVGANTKTYELSKYYCPPLSAMQGDFIAFTGWVLGDDDLADAGGGNYMLHNVQMGDVYLYDGSYYMVHGSSEWIQTPDKGLGNWIPITGELF